MKTTVLAVLATLAGSASAFHSKSLPVTGDVIEGEYVVTLRPDVSLQKSLNTIFTKGALDKVEHIYGNFDGATFKGYSLKNCDVNTATMIADSADVLAIEQSQVYSALGVQQNPTWGLDRVDQRGATLDQLYYYKDSAGVGVDMYTIDTGIRLTHGDFEGRAKFGYTAMGDDGGDRNGHGTHCSSTMAGVTWGVAKKANLFAVKVLGDNGSGSTTGVIAGIDWVNGRSSSRTKVGNLSLGGGASSTMDNAINAAVNVIHVVASGNSNANACNYSPARAANAYSVNSMQQGDSRSSFSNFGTCTKIFAPGSSITAAWSTSDTATNTISGTSMAAPHVAGIAALLISDSASLDANQVKAAITNLATPNAISNPGTGSPNLLAYNDRDGPSTPSPPTFPPTTPPPTERPACRCEGTWTDVETCLACEARCEGFNRCNSSGNSCSCNTP